MKAYPRPTIAQSVRTVIEEKIVEAAIDKAVTKYPRIEDIFSGLKWRMAREPQVGHVLPRHNPSVSLMKVDPDAGLELPGITVLYTYNNDEVDILAVRVIGPISTPTRKKS